MKALDELLLRVKSSDPELYERAMVERYEMTHGPHYDEGTGREVVKRMYSTDSHGISRTGEIYDFETVADMFAQHADRLDDVTTIWDCYVAVNMWAHDMGKSYAKRNHPEAWLIEDAMTWAFGDEDAKEGKLWNYLHASA